MKRWILFLCALSLLCLTGCSQQEESRFDFYYLRTSDTIRYGQEDALIAPVSRDITGQDPGLDYLLQLYLESPAPEGYHFPIPKGTYLLSTLWEEDTLVIVLSREFSTLDKMELTLAGACLSATCHNIAGTERIEVRSGDTVYEFDLQNFTFLDASTEG